MFFQSRPIDVRNGNLIGQPSVSSDYGGVIEANVLTSPPSLLTASLPSEKGEMSKSATRLEDLLVERVGACWPCFLPVLASSIAVKAPASPNASC